MSHVNYERYRIKSLPPSAFYIPNFITDADESFILRNVYSVPKPKWTCLSNRRLQDYGGIPHKNGMVVEKIPDWLNSYVRKVESLQVYPPRNAPNHVLVNEYAPGQGIMPHTDGPLFYPTITTISCASHTVLYLVKTEQGDPTSRYEILLEPCSLLVLKDKLYNEYLHGIEEITTDTIHTGCTNLDSCGEKYTVADTLVRKTRISLTIRNVPKVLKLKIL